MQDGVWLHRSTAESEAEAAAVLEDSGHVHRQSID